jgi:hypothetical protein
MCSHIKHLIPGKLWRVCICAIFAPIFAPIFAWVYLSAAPADATRAHATLDQIAVNDRDLHFDDVFLTESILLKVPFTNTSRHPLSKPIETGCGCTNAVAVPMSVPALSVGSIHVTLVGDHFSRSNSSDFRTRLHLFTESNTSHTNDGRELLLHGTFLKALSHVPPSITVDNFLPATNGGEATLCNISCHPSVESIELTAPPHIDDLLHLRVVRTSESLAAIVCSPESALEARLLEFQVSLIAQMSNGSKAPPVFSTVRGKLSQKLSWAPDRLAFGLVRGAATAKRTIVLKPNDGSVISHITIVSSPDWLTAEFAYRQAHSGGQLLLPLLLNPDAPYGNLKGILRISVIHEAEDPPTVLDIECTCYHMNE